MGQLLLDRDMKRTLLKDNQSERDKITSVTVLLCSVLWLSCVFLWKFW